MSSGNAKIGQPAPDFSATAVVNGQFQEIKLSNYKGEYRSFVIEIFALFSQLLKQTEANLMLVCENWCSLCFLCVTGKYVIFFFYPLDFTFVCPTEIIAFSDRVEEFRSIGCEVIGCSIDSHFSHLAW